MNEARQQQKNQQNKNIRNKSTNIPSSNHYLNKQHSATQSNPSPNNPQTSMNKSGNPVRRPPDNNNVKLPKVTTIGNSSVSNSSMKAIWEGGGKRSGHEGGSKEGHRKWNAEVLWYNYNLWITKNFQNTRKLSSEKWKNLGNRNVENSNLKLPPSSHKN